jgi:anti-sigma regulatory factor (Ser/Thr protein kinase)
VPSLPDAHATRAFPATPLAPARVRAFVSHVINGTALNGSADGMHDDLALVATELAVNAIRHAESPFTVSLAADDDRIRIIVGDTDPKAPRRRAPDVQDESGRGLLLVDALADAWGADPVDGGKLVWAELTRPRPSQG